MNNHTEHSGGAQFAISTHPSYKYKHKQGWKKCKNRIIKMGTYDCWGSPHTAQVSLLDQRLRWIAATLVSEKLDIIALQRVSLPVLHYLMNQTAISRQYYVSSTKQPWKASMANTNSAYQGMEPNCWPVVLSRFEPFSTHHIKAPHSPHCIATIIDIGFTTIVNVDLDTGTADKTKTIECFYGIQSHVHAHFNSSKTSYLGNFNFDLNGSSQKFPEKQIIRHLQDTWLKCQENITGLFVKTALMDTNCQDCIDRTDGTMGYTVDSYDNTLLFNTYGKHQQSRKHAILLNNPTLIPLKIKRFGTNVVFTINAEHYPIHFSQQQLPMTKTTKHGRVVEYYPSIYFGVVCTMKY